MAALLGVVGELLPTIATVAQTGLQIASAAGAFDKKSKSQSVSAAATTDTAKEQADAEEKKRRAYLASLAGGRGSTVLTGGKGLIGGQVVGQGLKAQLGA